jgi:hypothetical protein
MKNIETNTGEIVMYQPDETIRLEVRVENESVFLATSRQVDILSIWMNKLKDRKNKGIN